MPLRRLDGLAYELRRIAHKHKSGAFQEERIVSLVARGKAVRISPRWQRWRPVGALAVDYAARVFRGIDPYYARLQPSWRQILDLHQRSYRERRAAPAARVDVIGVRRSRPYPEAPSAVAHFTSTLQVRMGVSPITQLQRDGRVENRLLFSLSGIEPAVEEQAALLSLSFGRQAGRVRICRRFRPGSTCAVVFLGGVKHPWQSVCPVCRHTRGRPRRAWLPDSLRPELKKLRAFLDQQVHRGVLSRAERERIVKGAQADAQQVTDGLLPEAACRAKWQSLRRREVSREAARRAGTHKLP